MKNIIIGILTLILFCSPLNVMADGSAIIIGDSTSCMMFSASASSHYLLLSSNGVVSAWGDNAYGQCAAEPCDITEEPNYIEFDTDSKIVQVAAGNNFSLALDEDGNVWGWGSNSEYQLGISNPTDYDMENTPNYFTEPIKCGTNVKEIAAGTDYSAILTEDGDVYLSGNHETHKRLDFREKIKDISVKDNHIMALSENNLLYSCHLYEIPTLIYSFSGQEVLDISAGSEHGVIIVSEDNNVIVYAFGSNEKYQLGMEDTSFYADIPTPVLTIYDIYEKSIILNTGRYATFIDVYEKLSIADTIEEYCFGTGCFYIDKSIDDYTWYEEGFDKDIIKTPEVRYVNHCILACGDNRNIAYRIDDAIERFGNSEDAVITHIIEPTKDITTMYPYQYEDTEFQTYNVNFVKLNKEKFADEGKIYDEYTQTYNDKYTYWELVNEHQFKVKIKNFINGLGNTNYNPAISTITFSKEATGENRIVGTFGPSIWNFNTGRDRFETEKNEVNHGSENGTVLTVSAFINNMREDLPLNIPSDIDVYYESPGEITENTKLGLYIYGLPQGTTVEISEIVGNTFKLTLFGNSVSDLDYDSELKICYIRAEDGTVSGVVGDFDLNTVSVFAGERTLRGFLIKAMENTPESLTLSGSLTKGRENGKTITAVIAGGTFSENLNADNWTVTGVDGVSVSDIKRLNDNTVELTLSGNSGDRYTSAELKVTCNSTEYTDSRVYDENTGSFLFADLISENHILVERQRQSSGGSISVSVSKPTASIASGEVTKGTAVELKATGQNIKIYYTTDGTTPTDESELYSVPIIVDTDMTIKFIAVSGSRKSLVQTATYTVKRASINLKSDADKIKYIAADGNMFYPDEAISRYEILEWLNRLFDIEDINAKSDFSDVSDEYENIVNLFVGAEIIEGYPDKTFKGTAGITRAEFVKMLSDMLKYKHDGETTEYTDVSGHWCEQYIAAFSKNGLLKGYPDGTFKPDNIITRAEAVVILNRIANIKPIDINEKFFDDVTDTHWACGNIYAACYTIEK